MTERIDICNIALSMLGANHITALDDDSKEARALHVHYDIARDATLEAYEWSFAIQRFAPARDGEDPAWGFNYRFQVPANIMRVLSVGPAVGDWYAFEQDEWVVESGYILCDEEDIYCRGIRRITDEGIYSTLFCHAFAAKLATLSAFAITHSLDVMQTMARLYTGMLEEAQNRDGMQGRTRRLRKRRPRQVR